MNNTERIKNILNNERFKGCEDVLMGDVLHYAVEEIENIKAGFAGPKAALQSVKWKLKILDRLISCSYAAAVKEKPGALFLFSSSYGYRKDHRRTFTVLTELFPNSSNYIYDESKKSYSGWKLKYLSAVRQWRKILKSGLTDQPAHVRTYLLMKMTDAFCDYADAERLFGKDFPDVETLVVWCDVHPADSFFTQRFNAMGKKTVDLMHGSISVKHNAWTVLGVKSKYFIADSPFTKDLLEDNGYKGEVIVCGYPYSISEKPVDGREENSSGLGVILSAAILHDDNSCLCEELKSLGMESGSLDVKLHPSEGKDAYTGGELDIFDHVYGSEITSGDFIDKKEFAIIAPSTVVYEAIKRRVPFLLYADSKGLYSQFDMPAEITAGAGELKEKTEAMVNGSYDAIYESLVGYYTAGGNVKENYIKAFNSLGVY